jgi:hypothetical protein
MVVLPEIAAVRRMEDCLSVCPSCPPSLSLYLSQAATVGLLEIAAARLKQGGLLFIYGPFKVQGRFTTDSNRAFDESLRSQVTTARWHLTSILLLLLLLLLPLNLLICCFSRMALLPPSCASPSPCTPCDGHIFSCLTLESSSPPPPCLYPWNKRRIENGATGTSERSRRQQPRWG